MFRQLFRLLYAEKLKMENLTRVSLPVSINIHSILVGVLIDTFSLWSNKKMGSRLAMDNQVFIIFNKIQKKLKGNWGEKIKMNVISEKY